jgi:hypothetical protein
LISVTNVTIRVANTLMWANYIGLAARELGFSDTEIEALPFALGPELMSGELIGYGMQGLEAYLSTWARGGVRSLPTVYLHYTRRSGGWADGDGMTSRARRARTAP